VTPCAEQVVGVHGGGVTITEKVVCDWLPCASVAVHVTGVVPTGYWPVHVPFGQPPEAGVHVTGTVPDGGEHIWGGGLGGVPHAEQIGSPLST
jgi:hypothetical protein